MADVSKKATAGKPDASRKPGSEGLDYSNADDVCGGPVQNDIEAHELSPERGVKGEKSLPALKRSNALKAAKVSKDLPQSGEPSNFKNVANS